MAESYLDRPQDDDTPQAHPAFNRGKAKGIIAMLNIIRDIISGTDDGEGDIISPEINKVRRAILAYRETLVHASDKSTYLSKQAKESLEKAQSLVDSIKL